MIKLEKFPVVTSSNKHFFIGAKRVAYPFDKKKGIFVLNPIIDKISITANIEDPKTAQAVTHWIAMANQEGSLPLEPKHSGGMGYAKAAFLTVSKPSLKVLIQIGRKNKPGAIRFEFNPSHFTQHDAAKMDSYLMDLSEQAFGLAWVLKVGKITRADVAVDIIGAKFNDLIIELPAKKKVRIHVDEKGGLQTVTSLLGKGFKNMAYNKRAQTQEKKIHSEFFDHPWCRVEWTIGHTKEKMATLGNIKCPWESASIILPSLVPPNGVNGHVWRLFLDVCRFRGVAYALSQLPLLLRHRFGSAVSDPKNQIWKAKFIWSKLPESIQSSVFAKYY